MKIQFLLLSVDYLAGTERAALAQAAALADHHEVEIVSVLRIAPNGPDRAADPRVRMRYLADAGREVGRGRVDYEIARADELAELPSTLVPERWDPTLNGLCDVALERFLPAVDADVLVTMTTGMLVAAAQRLPAGTALVHQEHRSSMHRTAGREPLLAFAQRADAVVSLTEVNAHWLRDQLGRIAPPVHVIPNAAPGPEQPRSSLERPLIVAAGRLDGGKQYSHLVRAFGSVADQIPEWRLRIFGSGGKRPNLMRTARGCGLYDRVELPGVTTDLPAEWAKASVSALTSNREGLPLVILESFAAGVPVVAYDCPTGPSELIEHGVNGFLVPMNDEEALAGYLLELASDLDLRRRLGAAARESLHRFDRAVIAARWEELYTEVVAARRSQGAPWPTRALDSAAEVAPVSVPAPPAITPATSRRELVRLVVDALGGLDGWFALPARGETPPTFVVPHECRGEALDLLKQADFPAHVSLAIGEDDHWLVRRDGVAEAARGLRNTLVHGFSIEPWPEFDGRASHLARQAGVRLEFWSRDREGCLVTRRPNSYAMRVGRDDIGGVEIEGVAAPGLVAMAGPFVDDCQFPVDVVYTWVDDGDETWRAARAELLAQVDAGQQRREAAGAARFRNRDELRYSLRSIHAHAPWVRSIYVVTAGQRPEWLVDHPKVTVVDHSEILPQDALPTFNSHAIETALHKIPGLSEHFIYFNDDVFLGRPLTPEAFFSSSGSFAAFLGGLPVGLKGRDDRPFVQAGLNNRELLRQRFGITATHTMAHSPHPMRRSVLDALCQDFSAAVDQTARTPFRSATDVSVTSSLAQHYGLASGSAFVGSLELGYVNTSNANVKSRLGALLRRETDAFCLGDSHDYDLPEEKVGVVLADFFEKYFPVKAPWEAG